MATTEARNPAQIAAALAAGVDGAPVQVTLAEFKEIHQELLSKVPPEKAAIAIALFEGQALVRFPDLGARVLHVRDKGRRIARGEFEFPTASPRAIAGADSVGFLGLLKADIRATWFVALPLLLIGIGVYVAGVHSPLVSALAPLLTVASGLFITVFVLFGVGEVVRGQEFASRLFKGGVLQASLDADKYLVRLSIAAFIASVGAVSVDSVSPGLAQVAQGAGLQLRESLDGLALALLIVATLGISLAFRATVSYLLDRAAYLALASAATEVVTANSTADSQARSDKTVAN